MTDEAQLFEFGGFRLDAARRLLFDRDKHPIPLKPKVFDTLLYLVEHAGELLDKERLIKAVWGDVIVEENSLNQNVSLLRRVLGESPGDNEYIVTVPGRGYRFVATVKVLPAALKDSVVGDRAEMDEQAGTPGRMTRRYLVATAVALAVLMLLVWRLDWKDETPVQNSTSRPSAGDSAVTNVVRLELDVLPGHRLTGGVGYETYDFGLERPSLASFALSPGWTIRRLCGSRRRNDATLSAPHGSAADPSNSRNRRRRSAVFLAG